LKIVHTLFDTLQTGSRLTFEEALELYNLDLLTLGKFASKIRETRYGKQTFYNINRHINPTNICADVCQFCSFSASRKNPNPYTMSHDDILQTIAQAYKKDHIKEVHIVSAHNNQVGLEWYFDIFKKIKDKYPKLHIKALTAAEIHFLSKEYALSYDQIIDKMIQSGVDSMPGGGAEIFDEKIRKRICSGKVDSAGWLEIHKLWHQRKRMSNATMLFGHIENREHRIDHMMRLRDLQDETGGFNAFIPLAYQTENNFLKVEHPVSANELLKTIAISRIVLDNIPHIKAYWVTSSIKLALVAQEFGADDLDGTIQKESINSAAGAKSANGMQLHTFKDLIENSGFIPTQRDSLYNIID
jgi:aminodeoxyfutalosine synthase